MLEQLLFALKNRLEDEAKYLVFYRPMNQDKTCWQVVVSRSHGLDDTLVEINSRGFLRATAYRETSVRYGNWDQPIPYLFNLERIGNEDVNAWLDKLVSKIRLVVGRSILK